MPSPSESVPTPLGSTPATPPGAPDAPGTPDAPDMPDAPIALQRRQPQQKIFGNPKNPHNIVKENKTK